MPQERRDPYTQILADILVADMFGLKPRNVPFAGPCVRLQRRRPRLSANAQLGLKGTAPRRGQLEDMSLNAPAISRR